MGAASGIAQALASAKNEESKANSLTKSIEGKVPSRFAKSPSTQAPYKMARKASASASAKNEAEDTGESLGNQAQNVKAYTDAENK